VPSRRTVLGALAVALGGCAGSDDTATTTPATDTTRSQTTETTETTRSETTGTTGSETTETTGSTETSSRSLDLREANVVGVEAEAQSDGHRFDVTLIHDDDGEDGYANWWVVEALDGTELGRRELLHAHGTREFTRSTTVDLQGERCVVVRSHDQTHGYGGRAAVVAVDRNAVSFVDQGPERRAIMAGSCP
jgi:hypothetical protein